MARFSKSSDRYDWGEGENSIKVTQARGGNTGCEVAIFQHHLGYKQKHFIVFILHLHDHQLVYFGISDASACMCMHIDNM